MVTPSRRGSAASAGQAPGRSRESASEEMRQRPGCSRGPPATRPCRADSVTGCVTWCVRFLCCVTNDYDLSSPKQHTLIILQFLQVKNLGMAETGPLLRVSRGWNQGAAGLIPLPRSSGYWQNSVPCTRRTEVPVFVLAVNWGPLSAFRGHSCSLAMWPSYNATAHFCKARKGNSHSSLLRYSLTKHDEIMSDISSVPNSTDRK